MKEREKKKHFVLEYCKYIANTIYKRLDLLSELFGLFKKFY